MKDRFTFIHGAQVSLMGLAYVAEALSHSPDARLAAIGQAGSTACIGILGLLGLVSHSAVQPNTPPAP